MILGMGGIFQRHGKWYFKTRINGRLHRMGLAQFGITTEAQAKAYLRQMKKARLEGRLAQLDPSRATLAGFTKQYLEARAPSCQGFPGTVSHSLKILSKTLARIISYAL